MSYHKEYTGISNKRRVDKKRFTKQGSNIASEVTIKYDPSVITKKPKRDTRTAEEKRLDEENDKKLQQTFGGSQLSGLGLESGLGKDERIFKLQTLINKKEVVTLQSAMKALGLAKGTVTGYLKEIDVQLWDTDTQKFVGAKDGNKIGLE